MLTDDNRCTAVAVAMKLVITEVKSEILSEDKSRIVRKPWKAARMIAMAGVGIIDAPALAAADVGIAMETGTDAGMKSAGITLLKGDLTGMFALASYPWQLCAISNKTRSSHLFTTLPEDSWQQGCSIPFRHPALADIRCCRHVTFFDQCVAML